MSEQEKDLYYCNCNFKHGGTDRPLKGKMGKALYIKDSSDAKHLLKQGIVKKWADFVKDGEAKAKEAMSEIKADLAKAEGEAKAKADAAKAAPAAEQAVARPTVAKPQPDKSKNK